MTRPPITAVGRLATAAALIGLLSGCAPGHPEFRDNMPWDALFAPAATDPPWLETFKTQSDARAGNDAGTDARAGTDADHDRPPAPEPPQ